MDGTPVFDIKPYLPYADSHPDAQGGFGSRHAGYSLKVECPPACLELIPEQCQPALMEILAQDPRPSYQEDPARIYGMKYAGMNIRFYVENDVLHICGIEQL